MKPQIIDRYVYVKGVKISEATSKSNLDGNEILPLAYNDVNYNTTVDLISEYVDKVHDYLTTENYNDLKGQIDSERTNRQEADNELNQSIQDTKSELHSTISNVESELLNDVSDLQELIDNINDTGAANGVTLDTAQTITGLKTFATVPKSTANATEDTDLVNKKYVDDAVLNADVDLDGYATEAWVNELGFARTSDIPEGLELGETTGTAFPGDRGKAVEDVVNNISNKRSIYDVDFNNIYGRDNLNLRFDYIIPSNGATSSIDVKIPTVNSEIAGLMSVKDKAKLDKIITNGDGTKYLSDDGTYKELNVDTSTLATKEELTQSINQLGSTFTSEVTELEKTNANLSSQISTINESIAGLDDQYLPLSGGTLSDSLTVTGGLTILNGVINLVKGYINYLKILFDGLSVYLYNNEHSRYRIKLGPDEQPMIRDNVEKKEYKIYHEGHSKVTTNNISGGLNITSITQSAYDELQDKDANTLYIITE